MKQEILTEIIDLNLVKERCAEEIWKFGIQLKLIRKLYDNMGFDYPEECNTNYRDAWFHYRKLYKKKDRISILNEKYGMEEHLLRAAKDAQINFLQQLGYWLEVWYRYDHYVTCDMGRGREYEELFAGLEKNWVKCIEEKTQGDDNLFANACLYYFVNHIYSDDLQKKLQALVHSIKNMILDIRLGGVTIFRPTDNIYYFNQCVSVYNNMCSDLYSNGLLYLISSTGLIMKECGK